MRTLALSCMAWATVALAKTVSFDWNVTWVPANPDDAFTRPTMGINGQWPLPQLNITKSDRVLINVNNQLGNQSTSLHFHGLYMNGTTHMDGPVQVSQCGIPPGSSFTYNFTIDQPGTYWYHAHARGQYPDGLRAPLIVHDPENPYAGQYDEEYILTLSDWYHDEMPGLIKTFISVTNPTGAEPVPDAALMNDSQNVKFSVEPGKTYFFRIINMGAFASQYLWIEGHTMKIVEVDGVYTEQAEADMIYVTVAQRYGVLVTARNDTAANFAITGSMDQDLFDTVPDTLNCNVTGWLVYDNSKPMTIAASLDSFEPFDDFILVPYDQEALLTNVDHQIVLDMKMDNLGDGANYAFFNDVTYVSPKVPSLYTALSTGSAAADPAVYGVNSNAFVLSHGETVELVLNNQDTGKHPFHLHGHAFQVAARSAENAGAYTPNSTLAAVPMRRDTLMVRPLGHFAIRFRADNPGVWLFHCHIEWHVDSGLVATVVEAPLALQQQALDIPADHMAACASRGVPAQGNAAGNTKNFFDLAGANVSPAPLPAGFTARGIVALVFSVVSAFLGMAVISWYGAAPIAKGKDEGAVVRE